MTNPTIHPNPNGGRITAAEYAALRNPERTRLSGGRSYLPSPNLTANGLLYGYGNAGADWNGRSYYLYTHEATMEQVREAVVELCADPRTLSIFLIHTLAAPVPRYDFMGRLIPQSDND